MTGKLVDKCRRGLPSFGCKEPHIISNNQTVLVAQVEQDGIQSETKGIVLKAACNVEGISTESYSITKVKTLPFYKSSGNLIGGLERVPMDDEQIFIVGSDSMFTEFTSQQFASPNQYRKFTTSCYNRQDYLRLTYLPISVQTLDQYRGKLPNVPDRPFK